MYFTVHPVVMLSSPFVNFSWSEVYCEAVYLEAIMGGLYILNSPIAPC